MKLRPAIDDQAFTRVVDEDVTEENAIDHSAKEEVGNDCPGEHEDLAPKDPLSVIPHDDHDHTAPPDRSEDARDQEAYCEAGGEQTGLYLLKAPNRGRNILTSHPNIAQNFLDTSSKKFGQSRKFMEFKNFSECLVTFQSI